MLEFHQDAVLLCYMTRGYETPLIGGTAGVIDNYHGITFIHDGNLHWCNCQQASHRHILV